MTHNKKLPKDVINHWPEIFEDLEIESVPLEYILSIEINFRNDKTWYVDIEKQKDKGMAIIEESLEQLFEEYEDEISNINFVLNVEKVKKDIKKRTNRFLKKRK